VPRSFISAAVIASLALVSCGSDADSTDAEAVQEAPVPADSEPQVDSPETRAPNQTENDESTGEQQFPDVVDATAIDANGSWTFNVTVSSPYDTPERYADGWRIVGPDGTEFGFRLLTHDHAGEQPFTRSLSSVSIPDDVDVVTIEGRDQANGFGGEIFELQLR
jgi:hypothetical protein